MQLWIYHTDERLPAPATWSDKVALYLRLSLALAALAGVALAAPRTVTINNTAPRLDSSGVILDGHDLTIRQLPDGSCKYKDTGPQPGSVQLSNPPGKRQQFPQM